MEAATICCVVRLRNTLERASRRHRLGLLIVLCFALLLAVLSFHTAEHGVEEGVALSCAVVVFVAIGLRVVRKQPATRLRFEPLRIATVRSVPVAAPAATESPPGFSPLRL